MTNGRCGSASSFDHCLKRVSDAALGDGSKGDDKKQLRQAAKARRGALTDRQRASAAQQIADRSWLILQDAAIARRAAVDRSGDTDERRQCVDSADPGETAPPIAGYVPVGTEADVMPLLCRLAAAGYALALPEVVGVGLPLRFRRWAQGAALITGRYGIPCPKTDAPLCSPWAMLVPLLAFDRYGHRLGYGGGFYDRTLADCRRRGAVLSIGVAFAEQELAAVPTDRHDQPLDWIVTDRDAICVGS